MEKLIDLSYPIEDNMPVYPGDIQTNLFQTKYVPIHQYNDHRLEVSMHSGTHIDSPLHFKDHKEYISQLSLTSFMGLGCILDVRSQSVIRMKAAYENIIQDNSIVLLYTGQDKLYGTKEYYEEHPCVDIEFCNFLVQKKIKMLGMDLSSPDQYPFLIHSMLFENNIFILENLTNLEPLLSIERFEIIAFPLKIKADSSMTRAVARIF